MLTFDRLLNEKTPRSIRSNSDTDCAHIYSKIRGERSEPCASESTRDIVCTFVLGPTAQAQKYEVIKTRRRLMRIGVSLSLLDISEASYVLNEDEVTCTIGV